MKHAPISLRYPGRNKRWKPQPQPPAPPDDKELRDRASWTRAWDRHASGWGLPADALGRVVTIAGAQLQILGFAPRSPWVMALCTTGTRQHYIPGSVYCLNPRTVRDALESTMNDDTTTPTTAQADATTTPNRGGRKPVPDDERLRPRSIRMTDDDWQLLTQLGGATWMRGALARERKLAKRRAAATGGA